MKHYNFDWFADLARAFESWSIWSWKSTTTSWCFLRRRCAVSSLSRWTSSSSLRSLASSVSLFLLISNCLILTQIVNIALLMKFNRMKSVNLRITRLYYVFRCNDSFWDLLEIRRHPLPLRDVRTAGWLARSNQRARVQSANQIEKIEICQLRDTVIHKWIL